MHPLFGEFDEWYEISHPRVLATVLLVTGNLDRAADATDEAFTRALAVRVDGQPVELRVSPEITDRRFFVAAGSQAVFLDKTGKTMPVPPPVDRHQDR